MLSTHVLDAPILSQRQQLSDLLGSASFVVWLFAQSPQLYENYKNGSCDGLSVVFLVQWMLGDVTNLIGSVLTHQLPFQIAIATYFCCVDACILVQYAYYWRKEASMRRRQTRIARRIHHRSRTLDLRSDGHYWAQIDGHAEMSASATERALSIASRSPDNAFHRQSSSSTSNAIHTSDSRNRARLSMDTRRPFTRRALTMDADKNYRALGEAARSVAQLANETEVKLAERRARQKWAWSLARMKATKKLAEPTDVSASLAARRNGHDEEHDASVPESMTASISGRSISSSEQSDDGYAQYGFASTPNLRPTNVQSPALQSSRRGRGMTRMAGIVEAAVNARNNGNTYSTPSSPVGTRRLDSRPGVSRSSTRGSLSTLSAKPPGLILLGLAFLFTFGQVPSSLPAASSNDAIGHLAQQQPRVIFDGILQSKSAGMVENTFSFPPGEEIILTWQQATKEHPGDTHDHPTPPASWDRVVGRLSAWSCTVLYMTSRMPQIWTNMQRRSVQGLSILLFIAAATGNLLYTLSILVNPQAQSPPRLPAEKRAYIMESLPFLLGSGGTLIFDAIIVAQWAAWRGKAPVLGIDIQSTDLPTASLLGSRSRSRKTSTQSRWHSLERQSLLS